MTGYYYVKHRLESAIFNLDRANHGNNREQSISGESWCYYFQRIHLAQQEIDTVLENIWRSCFHFRLNPRLIRLYRSGESAP